MNIENLKNLLKKRNETDDKLIELLTLLNTKRNESDNVTNHHELLADISDLVEERTRTGIYVSQEIMSFINNSRKIIDCINRR